MLSNQRAVNIERRKKECLIAVSCLARIALTDQTQSAIDFTWRCYPMPPANATRGFHY